MMLPMPQMWLTSLRTRTGRTGNATTAPGEPAAPGGVPQPVGPAGRAAPQGAAGAFGPDEFWSGGRLVGAVTGGELLRVTRERFVRLARAGCFRPVRWYVNRYRAVVWLYSADEVAAFAEEQPEWLTGRLPEEVRAALDDGLDLRAAGWRTRRAALLAARSADAWQEAAVWLALLGPERCADLVAEPRERALLAAVRPCLLTGRPPGPADAGQGSAVPLMAQEAREIAYARRSLAGALSRARAAADPRPPERSPNLCSKTVTRRGQRLRRPRCLTSRRDRAPHRPARGARGERRSLTRSVRPDQSKGRP